MWFGKEENSESKVGECLGDRMKLMLDNQLMCDVIFHVGSEKLPIKAHKYMLASASPVFFDLFEGQLLENELLIIVDMTMEQFKIMLEYMYTDKDVVNSDNIKGLMYGSEKYKLQRLKELCNSFLQRNANSNDHACVVFQMAHDYDIERLRTRALNNIFKNGNKCFQSNDFLHLSTECLKLLLGSDSLDCREEVVYQSLIKWAYRRCEEQSLSKTDEHIRKSLGGLLYYIRFPCMDRQFFTAEVTTRNILTFEEMVIVYQHLFKKFSRNDLFSAKIRNPKKIEKR